MTRSADDEPRGGVADEQFAAAVGAGAGRAVGGVAHVVQGLPPARDVRRVTVGEVLRRASTDVAVIVDPSGQGEGYAERR